MVASYSRSVVGAVVAVYMTGATNPTDYLKAGIAALIPPVLRWANPKDSAYGLKK
tara:strand:+ start:6597 stop:6761 length:165 start_codon:yes stop_codon:yes gene_type:complete